MPLKFWTVATHKISGFKGTVMGRTEYANGCVKYLLVPKGFKSDGSPKDGEWFDSQEVVGAKENAGGGPMPLPPRG